MLLRHFYSKNTPLLGQLTKISHIFFTKRHSIGQKRKKDTHIFPFRAETELPGERLHRGFLRVTFMQSDVV